MKSKLGKGKKGKDRIDGLSQQVPTLEGTDWRVREELGEV